MKPGIFVSPALLAAIAALAAQLSLAQEAPPPAAAAEATPSATAPEAAPKLSYSNKWRLEVSEGANNDGVIRLRITPKGQEAMEVTVSVRKGRSENGVADDIRDALKAALDKKRFHVEVDDGEDVLVKKKGGPDFSLAVVESTLKGTRLHLEKE